MNPVLYLTVARCFNAVHTLSHPSFTRGENYRMFGECANPAGHGHLFRVEVTFRARVSKGKPVVVSREGVRRIFDEILAPKFLGHDLGAVTDGKERVPTGENLVRTIWDLVEGALEDGVVLSRVTVEETRKNSFSFVGEDPPSVKTAFV